MSTNKQGQKISEETRAAILAADPSISHADLARKYGISDVSARKIRMDGGVFAAKRSGSVKPAAPRTKEIVAIPQPAVKPSGMLTVAIDIDEQRADAFWRKLSAEDKSIAIRSILMARLETI